MFECPPWGRGCDNCMWYNPEDQKIGDCKHAKLEKNEAGVVMNCTSWMHKDYPGSCSNCALYDPDTKMCRVHKVHIYQNDVDAWRCSYWEPRKKTLGDKVLQAVLQNPHLRVVDDESEVRRMHCGNCKYHNKHDSMCPEGHATHGDSCKNWEPDEEKIEQEKPIEKRCNNCGSCHPFIAICQRFPDKSIWPAENHSCEHWEPMKEKKNPNEAEAEKKKPVFGGTSLCELEVKAKVWSHKKEAAALDRGVQQGGMLEMLDTVFDIACQQVPACSERWTKLKTQIHYMLCSKWAAEEDIHE